MSGPAARGRPWSEVFDQVAADYGSIAFFHRFGQALVAFARIGPGAMVVDVACGRGACLLPAIQAADAGGRTARRT